MKSTFFEDIRVPDEFWKNVRVQGEHWVWAGPMSNDRRPVPRFRWHGFSIPARVFVYCRLVTNVQEVRRSNACSEPNCIRPECMNPKTYGLSTAYVKLQEYLIVKTAKTKGLSDTDYVSRMLAQAREDAGNRCG